jgi:glutaredoxin
MVYLDWIGLKYNYIDIDKMREYEKFKNLYNNNII